MPTHKTRKQFVKKFAQKFTFNSNFKKESQKCLITKQKWRYPGFFI